MGLETATYIDQLVETNPVHTDGLDQADAHLRLIKATLLNTFPNFTANALQSTQAQIDGLTQSYVGALQPFAAQPTSFQNGGGSGTGAAWLECDGSVYVMTSYPALGAQLGSKYGGNGTTTFGVPVLTDTGRFIRSRSTAQSFVLGQAQSNQFASHTHTASSVVTDPGHNHTLTDPGHSHTTYDPDVNLNITGGGGGFARQPNNWTSSSGNNFTTSTTATGITLASNTTGITVATTNTSAGAGTETRPEAFVAIICIKT